MRIQTVSFTGPRPQTLQKTPHTEEVIQKRIYSTIQQLIEKKGVSRFISGGAVGVDQMAFLCIHWLKKQYPHIENILAIPFAKQSDAWNEEEKEKYEEMKKVADSCVYVDTLTGYQTRVNVPIGDYHGSKMQLRNMYMVDHSDLLIAVFEEGKKGGTFNCVTYARKKKHPILHLDLGNGLQYRDENLKQ